MSSRQRIGNQWFLLMSALFVWGIINACAPSLEGPTVLQPSSFEKARVPFRQMGPLVVVKGILNEKVSMDFMVDTAAGITVIPQTSAKKLGIDLNRTLPTIPLQTAAEIIHVPLVVLDSIDVGGMQVKNITVAVYDPPFLDRPGVLGLNFLKHFRVEVDFKEGFLVLEKR
jgi:clan AA aspartic protease (TIGR02281 family)